VIHLLAAELVASFNWLTLTASVALTPAAKPVIVLPPMSIPEVVTLGPPAMVKPLALSVTAEPMATPLVSMRVLPVVMLPSLPRSMSLASLICRPSVPLATTPMLPSVSSPVAPIAGNA